MQICAFLNILITFTFYTSPALFLKPRFVTQLLVPRAADPWDITLPRWRTRTNRHTGACVRQLRSLIH